MKGGFMFKVYTWNTGGASQYDNCYLQGHQLPEIITSGSPSDEFHISNAYNLLLELFVSGNSFFPFRSELYVM